MKAPPPLGEPAGALPVQPKVVVVRTLSEVQQPMSVLKV
jgi:hypothetical protein